MTGLIDKLKNLIFQRKQQMAMLSSGENGDENTAVLTNEILVELLRQIENTKENCYSCEETFALLDEYVELISDDLEAEMVMPLVKAHLDACPDCHQSYQILRKIVESE